MNEISFKDFNKSQLNNKSDLSALNLQYIEENSSKKDVRLPIEVSNKNSTNKAGNLSTLSISFNKNSKTTTANEINKIPFKPPGINSSSKNNLISYQNEKETLYSTWTPLSDQSTNTKLYAERKQLFLNWFKTWNENQRRQAITEMLSLCQPKQLYFARDEINKISPIYQIDFTRILPRVVCLYIFSFLDPRSLSRCAQVCWYWKILSEADQLWMPKCLRFGWNLNYIPTSFESGIWKQFYIENIKALQYIPLKKNDTPDGTHRSDINLNDLSYGRFGFNKFMKHPLKNKFRPSSEFKQPPWRTNNSNPNHFYRFNYLDANENQSKNEEHYTKRRHPINKTVLDPKEHKAINKSLENLIKEGQLLIDEMNVSDKDQLNNAEIRQNIGKTSQKKQIVKSDSESTAQLWNMLDKSDTDL